ncbi:MAG: hypothetical protein H8K07_17165 [Nitrospira sp.]|nr:hypothetical protein [Nitrospira sp.]
MVNELILHGIEEALYHTSVLTAVTLSERGELLVICDTAVLASVIRMMPIFGGLTARLVTSLL